jgi:hypothetical protein
MTKREMTRDETRGKIDLSLPIEASSRATRISSALAGRSSNGSSPFFFLYSVHSG